MSEEQASQEKVYVDYAILSPFGPLPRSAGPFNRAEADDFIKELVANHKQLLVRADKRVAESR